MHFGLFPGDILSVRKRRFSPFLTVAAFRTRQLRHAPPCGVAPEAFPLSVSESGQSHLPVVDRPLPRPSADEPDAGLLHERTDARQQRVRLRGHGPEIVKPERRDRTAAPRPAADGQKRAFLGAIQKTGISVSFHFKGKFRVPPPSTSTFSLHLSPCGILPVSISPLRYFRIINISHRPFACLRLSCSKSRKGR